MNVCAFPTLQSVMSCQCLENKGIDSWDIGYEPVPSFLWDLNANISHYGTYYNEGGVCMPVCSCMQWCTCEGQSTNLRVGPHLPPCYAGKLCHDLSGLCLPSHNSNPGIANVCCPCWGFLECKLTLQTEPSPQLYILNKTEKSWILRDPTIKTKPSKNG